MVGRFGGLGEYTTVSNGFGEKVKVPYEFCASHQLGCRNAWDK